MGEEPPTPAPQDGISNGTDPKPGMGTTSETDGISGTTAPQTESLEDLKRELEAARVALKKANKDAGDHRKKAEELDRLKADQEAATLSETQKLQKQLEKIQAEHENALKELQQTKLAHAVSLAAQKLGFHDPSDAMHNIDQSQLNEDYSNVEALLKDVLSHKSWLATTGKPVAPTSGGATNPPRQSNSSGEITEQYAMDVLAGKIKGLSQQELLRVNEWVVSKNFGSFNRRA